MPAHAPAHALQTSTHWGAKQVRDPEQLVTQVFGSACAVSYSGNNCGLWQPIAQLILQASYEATLWVALQNAVAHEGQLGSKRVFLTALGGWMFGG